LQKDYKDYNVDIQKVFLTMMISDTQLYTRIMNILNPENFDKTLRPAAKFIKEYNDQYNILPDVIQIQAVTGLELTAITLQDQHHDWFLDEFEQFTKRQELERAIIQSADLLEKNDWNTIQTLIKNAYEIHLLKDMGTDYFSDPRGRLMTLKNSNGQISTGWPCIDRKLYGGFNRGELQIFAGGSGSGKSLFMQNLAVNWAMTGLNGVYITLELNEGLCAYRIDSMVTGVGSRDIFKQIDDVELKVKMVAKTAGLLQLKYMPAQSTVNDIRSYCKELEIQTKKKIDFLCVDYLDLLMPVSTKVSPSDLFIKDKYVSEELRNLAKELRVLFVTASQLNRSAVEEIEFDHSHISGGISKINTADNVFGIFTSRSMREKGRYQLQLMKTRSSSGVGQKIELEFNINTLRITDPDPEGLNNNDGDDFNGNSPAKSPNQIMSYFKTQSKVSPPESGFIESELRDVEPNTKTVVATVGNTALKNMLSQLKKR
jgi:archaellum biogenesis ATPase FlaH